MKTKNPPISRGFYRDNWYYSLVRPTGLEPVTLYSGGIRSNPTELRAHIILYEIGKGSVFNRIKTTNDKMSIY